VFFHDRRDFFVFVGWGGSGDFFVLCVREKIVALCVKIYFFLLFRWFCIMVEDLVAWLTIDIALKPQLNSPIGLGASVFLFNILREKQFHCFLFKRYKDTSNYDYIYVVVLVI
jgi:hypothetical protein